MKELYCPYCLTKLQVNPENMFYWCNDYTRCEYEHSDEYNNFKVHKQPLDIVEVTEAKIVRLEAKIEQHLEVIEQLHKELELLKKRATQK